MFNLFSQLIQPHSHLPKDMGTWHTVEFSLYQCQPSPDVTPPAPHCMQLEHQAKIIFKYSSQVPEVDSKAGTNKRSFSGAVTDMPGNDIDQSIPDKQGDQIQGKEGDTAQNPGNEAENPGNENAEGDQTPEETEDSAQNPAEVRTVAKPEAQEVKVAENPAERASVEVDESAKASESERQV